MHTLLATVYGIIGTKIPRMIPWDLFYALEKQKLCIWSTTHLLRRPLLNKVGANHCHDSKRCKKLVFGTASMQYAQKKKKYFVYSAECTIFVLTFSDEESIMENVIMTEKNKKRTPPIGDTK